MPITYRRGKRISKLKGQVRNGLAVVVHSPLEIDGLGRLAEAMTTLPGDPLGNLYRVLANAGRTIDVWPSLPSQQPMSVAPEHDAELAEGMDRRMLALQASLWHARQIWSAQGSDVDQLAMALVIPRPGRRATLDTRRPALVFDYGSIRARVVAAGGKLREFAVALFPISRARRKANVVEALRDNAVGNRLPRLETVRPADLEGKSGVIVFLHGLLSTDAGTFDHFVNAAQSARGLGPSVLTVGWPHDTLDPIELNAEDLAAVIERTLGSSPLPIAFVCHSRGGLVARRTIVELMEIDRDRWARRVRGLVTFGTPHEGAELAERGDEFVGKLLLAYTTVQQGGLVPLVDALWAVKDHKRLAGITDLRPRSTGGDFLRRLRKAESRLAKKAGGVPLPLVAIGGNAPAVGLAGMLTRRYFGGAAHDLIVPLASATPSAAEHRTETTCNHFEYFTPAEAAMPHAENAVNTLRRWLAPAPATQAAPRTDTPSPAVVRATR